VRRTAELPQGPRLPASVQTLASWFRPTAWLDRLEERYGKRFTIRFLGQPQFVVLSDPQDIKEVFQAPPDVLHPGEGARVLEPIVGPNSVILLDESPHLEQRKLMLPAFHGERMQALETVMSELTEREVAHWPTDEPVQLHARLQRLTLEIVLRAVFGLEQGAQLERLRQLLTSVLEFAENPISLLPPAQRLLAGRGPMKRLESYGGEADRLIYELIDQRRAEDAHGPDVLAMLLAAKHEDGSPMSALELRDELVTALVAGHETTASQLAWGLQMLARAPHVARRVAEEAEQGEDDAYLTATIHEIMRLRPVLPNAEPRLVKQPVEIGGVRYPPGVVLIANAHLVHRDPEIYPQPLAFRPERFLEQPPGTYTWLPFGGGRRRCLGASFAMLEMKIALRTVLARYELLPSHSGPDRARRRSITISPADSCRIVLLARERSKTMGRPEGTEERSAAEPPSRLAALA
jgi:cytochrome P450